MSCVIFVNHCIADVLHGPKPGEVDETEIDGVFLYRSIVILSVMFVEYTVLLSSV